MEKEAVPYTYMSVGSTLNKLAALYPRSIKVHGAK
jgi:hypothetical protein